MLNVHLHYTPPSSWRQKRTVNTLKSEDNLDGYTVLNWYQMPPDLEQSTLHGPFDFTPVTKVCVSCQHRISKDICRLLETAEGNHGIYVTNLKYPPRKMRMKVALFQSDPSQFHQNAKLDSNISQTEAKNTSPVDTGLIGQGKEPHKN